MANNKKLFFSIASFVLAAAPIAILLAVFLFCFIASAADPSGNIGSAVWWLFIAAVIIFVPVAAIAGILSVIFGILALRGKKTVLAWAGIGIVFFELLAVLAVLLVYL